MKKYNITVNGTTYEVIVEEVGSVTSTPTYVAPAQAPTTPSPQAIVTKSVAHSIAGSRSITAPMPGTILDVLNCKSHSCAKSHASARCSEIWNVGRLVKLTPYSVTDIFFDYRKSVLFNSGLYCTYHVADTSSGFK